jgi:amino acid adenylation domain-containing protein
MRYESVQELFDKAAALHGDRTALSRADKRVTYRRLAGRANGLANLLIASGAAKGSTVAVVADDSIEVITAILGVLKAGCVFVPLDPKLPANRLDAMLSLVSPRWFVVEAEYFESLGAHASDARVIILDDCDRGSDDARENLTLLGNDPAHFDTSRPQVAYEPDDMCYVYFTSGSTGQPKGIAGRLKGIDHFIRWELETLNLGDEVRASQLLPATFDGSLRDIFVPLCSGGAVCIPESRDTILDTSRLVKWIDEQRINVIHCVPSLFRSIVNEDLNPSLFQSLRYILMAGEPLLPSDVGRWVDVFGERTQLVNLYGTSETTMAKFFYFVRPADKERPTIPIGRPMRGAAALVVDEKGRPCPPGMIGEIYIRTPYRSLGYYNQPELTEEAFVPNPFNEDPSDIVYKTGDYGRVLEDGNFEYLGRRDQQVKVRGIRVELAEIENLLRGHESVKDVAVVDREDQSGHNYLCAYIVFRDEAAIEALRQLLSRNLPDYMVPSAFVVMKALPRTITGKLDRRALPAPGQTRSGLESAYVGPRTPLEEVLCGVWSSVLGLARVGVRDNFFSLGGHSLLATQVMSRVRSLFQVELPLRSLFESPTVAGLAEAVEAARLSERGMPAPPLASAPRTSPPPLSFAQQRLWFIDRMGPGLPLYNLPAAVRLRGPLDVAALGRAFEHLVARHETLRTTFSERDGLPVQVIADPAHFELPVTDLSHLAADGRESEALRLADEEASAPFDLTAGPLLRVKLLRLTEDEHVLLLTMHHIVSDGWSMGVLVREMSALYAAYSSGEEPALDELPIQYADFAVWQREWLQGETLERQLSYWREHLRGAPPVLELPTDRPRPAVQTYAGSSVSVILGPELAERLRELSRREGATLFMTLLAAFNVLLSRWAGTSDVVVGSDIANRNRAETEGLIGFFVNMLVLRTNLGDDPTFRGLLGRVRESALDAYAHQDLPFEKLVEELQPERDLSHPPLFQVVFVLQNAPAGGSEFGGVGVEPLGQAGRTAKYDLTFVLTEFEGGIRAAMEYNADLFDRATVARMLGAYGRVLEGVVEDAGQRVSELPLLSDEERERVLVEWNGEARPYPREATLGELFREQARRTPDAVALSQGEWRLTYAELDAVTEGLARRLRECGVGPEVGVGVSTGRSVETVAAVVGIVKAGGYYLPVDAGLPLVRQRQMLEESGVWVAVTSGEGEESLPAVGGMQVVSIDEEWEKLARAGALSAGGGSDVSGGEDARAGLSADNLAYVMYTSGSTGRPKGVAVTHRNVVRLIFSQDYVTFGGGEVFLQLAPLSFDASTFEVWGALLTGARLAVMPDGAYSLSELGRCLAAERVTTLWLTAGLFHQMAGEEREALRGVRQLLAGGDVLEAGAVKAVLADMREGGRVVNGYGPTETTTFACCGVSEAGAGSTPQWRVPIGRALANTRVYVLDAEMDAVPVGVAGELYIGGDGVARGYLGRAGLTAERFIPDPFGREGGGRLYRTGDLVRYLESGELEFVGRADGQVKVRGYRIELGEVEAALRELEGVSECVVVAREEGVGDKRLVAYVVGVEGKSVEAAGLRRGLRERLPEYMTPSAFVELERLPLTLNGKVDKRALPEPEPEVESGGEYVAPRTPAEEVLCGIWAEVLGVERVGVEDDFFEMGGHSLLATQVVSRVREAFGVEVGLREMFERPRVEGLARAVEEARREGAGLAAPGMARVSRGGELPLSFAQQRLWFLSELEPGSAFYNVPTAVRLSGSLDVAALGRAIQKVVTRHEVLRTRFEVVDGRPIQVIEDVGSVPLKVEDLSGLEEEEREQAAKRLAGEEARRPFDLRRGPLLRVKLLRLAEDEHVVLLTMHHIISDGWSQGVLVKEFASLYSAYREGREPELPELPIQYADFAVWQRGWLQGEVLEKQLGYWREHLSGAPAVLEMPTSRPRGAMQTYRGARESFILSEELSEKLRRLSRREGATLFMTLLAAWKTLLARYSGQEDIVVGTPIANRNRAETESLIGFFVNTLVLRNNLAGTQSFRELLKQVRETTLGAYTHQDLPFEKLVEELQPERSLSHSPLFQVMFVLQNASRGQLELPELELKPVNSDTRTSKFDLSLDIAESGKMIFGVLDYNVDLYDTSLVRQLLRHFQNLLEDIADNPDERLSEYRMLDEEDERRALVEWNDTAVYHDSDECLHRLFEAQCERTPDSVAVTLEGRRLTYGELNGRANQLAHHLIEMGVAAETLVGIMAERSLEMVVGLLGILKAGGAYVPLDPEYPQERLAFMAEDCGARVFLTQQHLVGRLKTQDSRVVCLDSEWEAVARKETGNPRVAVSGDNLAYMIYTSGSTGRPKGAMNTHRAVCNRLLWMQDAYRLDGTDRVLQKTPFSFDVSVWEFFWPLMTGARLIMARPGGHRDSAYLIETISRERITTLHFVPSMLQVFLEEKGLAARCDSLRRVICSGEALPFSLQERFFAQLDVGLHNLYGPTEAAVDVTAWACVPGDERRAVPIGRPIANTQIYLLDDRLRPVPIGVAGELYIGGVQLARGYHNRGGLTAERFIPHPHGREPGARIYRTGDLARHLPGGEIEYLGRTDHQVKVRGFRIELGEIEAALEQQAGVREAVVLAQDDANGGKRLVAYLVAARDGRAATTDELRSHLRRKLPEYMIPSAFVVLEQLPLTPNSKVNRRELQSLEVLRGESADNFVPPRTPVEEALADIWAQVLRMEKVSVNDNFFDLGGHSLLATQVTSRIRDVLNVELHLRSLFESPTVADLSAFIEHSLIAQADEAELAAALEELDQLSDEDIGGLLQREGQLTPELGSD